MIASSAVIGAAAAPVPDALADGPFAVGHVDYTLGDDAFTVNGFTGRDGKKLQPIELTGTVHYPIDAARARHPLVVISHGQWETCADRDAGNNYNDLIAEYNTFPFPDDGSTPPEFAELDARLQTEADKLNAWPCAPGTPALPSYRGFDYLGEKLASQGMITLSISANGINAGAMGEAADAARAALINKHLSLWSQLDKGRGPLVSAFTREGSTEKSDVDFTGTVALSRVASIGHSRGGRGVAWQAADTHRAAWPTGVVLRAAIPLAAAGVGQYRPSDPGADDYRITKMPFLTWLGTCDSATGTTGQNFVQFAQNKNRFPVTQLTVHGANHNFLNTEWSPSSGQVRANDDIDVPGFPRPAAGKCTETLPRDLKTGKPAPAPAPDAQTQLSEENERELSSAYISAYLRSILFAEDQWKPMLTGTSTPYATAGRTGIITVQPASPSATKAPTVTKLKVHGSARIHRNSKKTLFVTVSAKDSEPRGSVAIFDGSRRIVTIKLSAAPIRFPFSSTKKGKHLLSASFLGSSALDMSSSKKLVVTVVQ